MKQILQTARAAAPYLMVALLVPGGSLIALAAWLLRSSRRDNDPSPAA